MFSGFLIGYKYQREPKSGEWRSVPLQLVASGASRPAIVETLMREGASGVRVYGWDGRAALEGSGLTSQ